MKKIILLLFISALFSNQVYAAVGSTYASGTIGSGTYFLGIDSVDKSMATSGTTKKFPVSSGTLGFSSLDMSTSVYSIPWAMGTATAPTTGGKAYLNPETAELTVGSGSSTFVIPLQTPGATAHAVYAAGTVYTMTNSSSLIHFGTTDPTITVPYPGRWHIRATARLEYAGATEASTGLATVKLRRTNNTAADLTNGSDFVRYAAVTTTTGTLGTVDIDIDYVTTNNNDILSLYGALDASPSVGSITCTAAKIYIQRIGGN